MKRPLEVELIVSGAYKKACLRHPGNHPASLTSFTLLNSCLIHSYSLHAHESSSTVQLRGGLTCVLQVQCIDVMRSRDNIQAKCTELVVIRARMSDLLWVQLDHTHFLYTSCSA